MMVDVRSSPHNNDSNDKKFIAENFPSRCPIEETKRLLCSCRFHGLRFEGLSPVVYVRNQQVHKHNKVAISSCNVEVLQVMVPLVTFPWYSSTGILCDDSKTLRSRRKQNNDLVPNDVKFRC